MLYGIFSISITLLSVVFIIRYLTLLNSFEGTDFLVTVMVFYVISIILIGIGLIIFK